MGLHSCEGPRLAEEINKLGVRQVLLRIPVWEVDELEKYTDFLNAIPDCEVAVSILQNREYVLAPDAWRRGLRAILDATWPRVRQYQVGQGANRSKWGFFTYEEFLAFASEAELLREAYPGIAFVGPGILDFETLAFLRCLSHGFPIHWDIVGCGLYVDRRGSPRNRQMLLFDIRQKILHFAACARVSTKATNRLWVTEVNWPLVGQGKYAPTSHEECVSEEAAGRYLTEYYSDAWETGLVERVYWWQLVSKGFGLMDVEDSGKLRPRPAYRAFKKLLEEGIPPRERV